MATGSAGGAPRSGTSATCTPRHRCVTPRLSCACSLASSMRPTYVPAGTPVPAVVCAHTDPRCPTPRVTHTSSSPRTTTRTSWWPPLTRQSSSTSACASCAHSCSAVQRVLRVRRSPALCGVLRHLWAPASCLRAGPHGALAVRHMHVCPRVQGQAEPRRGQDRGSGVCGRQGASGVCTHCSARRLVPPPRCIRQRALPPCPMRVRCLALLRRRTEAQ